MMNKNYEKTNSSYGRTASSGRIRGRDFVDIAELVRDRFFAFSSFGSVELIDGVISTVGGIFVSLSKEADV
jgi:hypothetical protein